MLTTTKEMINDAYQKGYAIPAVNTQGGNYDIIRAICYAAQKMNSPIILAHYSVTGNYSGDDWFVETAKWLAKKVSVPVAIHLDHGNNFDICIRALKYGFTSIMLDCSAESIEANIKHTNEVIKVSHALGIPVEAEVGELIRMDDEDSVNKNKNIANFEDIKKFLAGCSPDMLAVGIGNAHGYYHGKPVLKLDLLKQVRDYTNIPLVLHGCTGIPDEDVRTAIENGVAKINFGTLVRHKYVEYFREGIDTLDHQGHSWKISQYAENKLEDIIVDIIKLSGSENKA